MSGATEIFVWIVGVLVSVLLGFLGWALVEIYDRLKRDIGHNAARLDACYTKIDGCHAISTTVMQEQRALKKKVDSIETKTFDPSTMLERINIIGKKLTEQEKVLKEQGESHGRVIQVLNKIVNVRDAKPDKK